MAHEIPGGNNERNSERRIDLSTDEWTEKLAGAPLYRKRAVVHIRPAVPGELVVTTLADGSEETDNTAEEYQVVVTNPGGEKQIVTLEKAVMRYDLTDTPGLFLAKGMVRAVDNPFASTISITAPWGSPQRGDAGCKIVALYDPDEPDVVSEDRYVIGKDEFLETYGDQPVDLAVSDSAPVASALVLAALEEHNAQMDISPSEAYVNFGAMVLKLANQLMQAPETNGSAV
jgi:hypothetical protein